MVMSESGRKGGRYKKGRSVLAGWVVKIAGWKYGKQA